MRFPQSREEVFEYYRELKENPLPSEQITTDEYRRYFELSTFKCPRGWKPQGCNSYQCPTKKDNIWEDYYDDCTTARNARLKLKAILKGKIMIVNGIGNGWEIPV